jgi:hypothetical protein
MTTKRTISIAIGTLALLAVATTTAAEKGKKLYCWNEHGHKFCGDELPREAAVRALTEIS